MSQAKSAEKVVQPEEDARRQFPSKRDPDCS